MARKGGRVSPKITQTMGKFPNIQSADTSKRLNPEVTNKGYSSITQVKGTFPQTLSHDKSKKFNP